jgi:hypothetical protein
LELARSNNEETLLFLPEMKNMSDSATDLC